MKIVAPSNIHEIANDFAQRIEDAAAISTIEMTSRKALVRKQSFWWSSHYSKAVVGRRLDRRVLENYPSTRNAEIYKRKSAKVKKICNDSKHNFNLIHFWMPLNMTVLVSAVSK